MRGAKWLQEDAVSGQATPGGRADRGTRTPARLVPGGAQFSSVRACVSGTGGGAAAGKTKHGLQAQRDGVTQQCSTW